MSSPKKETEEPTSSTAMEVGEVGGSAEAGDGAAEARPPAKRRLSSSAVIEISDTESDDSDVCAVTSYQASADEVKRIRGADYSSSSSTSSTDSYSSDSESPWEDDSIVLPDPWPHCKTVHAQLNPRANRMEDPQLDPALKSQEIKEKLKSHWAEQKDFSTEEVTLTCSPFRVCLLHDLLNNPDIINNIVDDMNTLDWTRKKMDLYEFHQTVDLANLTWQRSIKGIYELLKTEVMSWVSEVTGLELTSLSASCSLYGPGDHLLCHDDRRGSRRVAFILYLAPWRPSPAPPPPPSLTNGTPTIQPVDVECRGWGPQLGGALELFSRDSNLQPSLVTHSVTPSNNMLAFFQVGPETFHQVSEVLSLELPRLSINGWFHGPGAPSDDVTSSDVTSADVTSTDVTSADVTSTDDTHTEPPPQDPPPLCKLHNDVVLLNQWIDVAYMSPVNRGHIQKQMERDSQVCLRNALTCHAREQLLELLEAETEWERCGPPLQRCHWRVPPSRLAPPSPSTDPLRGVVQLLTSMSFGRLLQDCTDLAVTHYSRLQVMRFGPGDYTLLPPQTEYNTSRLEAVLYLGVPNRAICGGATTYVAPEDEGAHPTGEALVTVPPVDNSLSLVYCDAGAASFTKYLSKLTMKPHEKFYVISVSYSE